MAVSLPSDLVADVIRNADPARRNAAIARLKAVGSDSTTFANAIDQASRPASAEPVTQTLPDLATRNASPGVARQDDDKNSTFRGFEQIVLRNLFETLLPAEDSGAFGGGPSAGVWRSMAADQLASVYSEDGGIGIARMLASSAPVSAPQRVAQWPYFSLRPLQAPGSEGKA